MDRELPAEAVHRTKAARGPQRHCRGIQTLKKDLATRVARKGGQWSDHFERAAGAYNAPTRRCPRTWSSRPRTLSVEGVFQMVYILPERLLSSCEGFEV